MRPRNNRFTTAALLSARSIALIALSLAFVPACASDTSLSEDLGPCEGKCDSTGGPAIKETYDYIVVGSGAGGGPLAARLAERGKSVLLLEAGTDQGKNQNYRVPAFHPKATVDPAMRWDYFVSQHDERPDPVFYPRSGTLGGCTAHNDMIAVYPHASDFEDLADATGEDSFSPGSMRSLFQRIESNRMFKEGSAAAFGHGYDGWMTVETPDASGALLDRRIRGALLATLSHSPGFDLFSVRQRDMNEWSNDRDAREGAVMIPLTTKNAARSGTRERILEVAAAHENLIVRTNAFVTRIIFENEVKKDGSPLRAVGVEYIDQAGSVYRADPRAPLDGELPATVPVYAGEVVLSAGVFNTPQMLMLNGIGPREELEKHDITVRLDSPGVGRNLQDRYEVAVVGAYDSPFGLVKNCTFGAPGDPCLAQWEQGHANLVAGRDGSPGPYGSVGSVISLIKKSSVAVHDPDLFMFGIVGNFRGYFLDWADTAFQERNVFTWLILKAHTRNHAGTVTLESTDPRDRPIIAFNSFAQGGEEDITAISEGIDTVRAIGRSMDNFVLFEDYKEIYPGEGISSRDHIRNTAWGHHAAGTAKLGGDDDPTAVLDGHFRVRGTCGLRVVDASVFPSMPGFFVVVPIYLMSENAADAITHDAMSGQDCARPLASQRQ